LLRTILCVMHALFSILNYLQNVTNFSSNLLHTVVHNCQLLQIQINHDVATDVILSTDNSCRDARNNTARTTYEILFLFSGMHVFRAVNKVTILYIMVTKLLLKYEKLFF
jgi:hypothetical protein